MEIFQQWLGRLKGTLDYPLLKLGETQLTLWLLLYLTVLIVLLFYVTGKLRNWLVYRALSRTELDLGLRQAAGSKFRFRNATCACAALMLRWKPSGERHRRNQVKRMNKETLREDGIRQH